MKSKKFMIAGLLAMAGSMILASCKGGGSSSAPTSEGSQDASSASDSSAIVSSDDSSVASESSESGPNYPTKVKITQPGILIVGTSIDARDYVTVTPEGAEDYTLVSDDPTIAAVAEDGRTINILASGSTKVSVKVPSGEKMRVLGNIKIDAMSEEGKAIQDIADSITNQFRADYVWTDYLGKTIEKWSDADKPSNTDLGTMVVSPDYVLDWFFGSYSAIHLNFDDNYYNFGFLDADGEAVEPDTDAGDTSVADTFARIADVEILERASAAYVTQYFVLDNFLNVADWDEETDDSGSHFFTIDDNDAAQEALGAIYGAVFSGFSNGCAKLWLDEESQNLRFQFAFDYFDTRELQDSVQLIDVTLSYGEGSGLAVLDNAVKTAEPPAPTDVSGLADAFAAYATNGVIDFELGIFDRNLQLLDGDTATKAGIESGNTVGTVVLNDGIAIWESYDRDLATGEIDPENPDYGGIMVDTVNGGGYLLNPSEIDPEDPESKAGLIVAEETAITGSAEVNTWSGSKGLRAGLGLFCTDFVTKDVLDAASLAELDEGIYKYDATFDDCALGSLIATFSPYMYSNFFVAENAQYIDSNIVYDAESGEIDIVMMMRVGLTVDGQRQTAYQGLLLSLYNPGAAPEVSLGDSFADIFDSLYAEEEGGEEGGVE